MNHVAVSVVALLALGLSSACGGGGGAAQSLQPPSQVQMAASPDPAEWNVVVVSWSTPSGSNDGYELESSLGGPFTKAHTGLIPASVTTLKVALADPVPEGVTARVRLRSMRGGQPSAYSNEASLALPLLGVADVSQPARISYDPLMEGWAGVPVSWGQRSAMATQTRVERRAWGSGNPWAQVALIQPQGTLVAGVSLFYDDTAAEGADYEYRLTNLAGSAASVPAMSTGPHSNQVFSPSQVTLTAGSTGPVLTWVNHSPTATDITVRRQVADYAGGSAAALWPVLANLPASATTFTDAGLPAGSYVYVVIAHAPAGAGVSARVTWTQP